MAVHISMHCPYATFIYLFIYLFISFFLEGLQDRQHNVYLMIVVTFTDLDNGRYHFLM